MVVGRFEFELNCLFDFEVLETYEDDDTQLLCVEEEPSTYNLQFLVALGLVIEQQDLPSFKGFLIAERALGYEVCQGLCFVVVHGKNVRVNRLSSIIPFIILPDNLGL